MIYVCRMCGQTSLLPGVCASCAARRKYVTKTLKPPEPVQSLADVSVSDVPRYPVIGFPAIENSLAGGFVQGSALLLHGGPGVGKSTLALQLVERMGRYQEGGGLYITSEQMLAHVKMLAMRIQLVPERVRVMETKQCEDVIDAVEAIRPALVVVDSLQMIGLRQAYEGRMIVAACETLTLLARRTSCAMVLVCHETKGDEVAGPRTLEHIVDGMIALVAQGEQVMWMLHSKYRFGPVPYTVALGRHATGAFYERFHPAHHSGSPDREGSAGAPSAGAESGAD